MDRGNKKGRRGQLKENAPHIIAIAILIFILLLTLTRFGYLQCDEVPGFCGIYYGIFGKPQVAIVHGKGAIGDPELLREAMIESENIFPAYIDVENIQSTGILGNYDIVIVEGPKEISTSTLKVFAGYVQKGGKLVWVGNAGIELGENDYVCRQPKIHYVPSRKYYQNSSNSSGAVVEQCGEWVTLSSENGGLNYPEELEAGICGKSFGEIVVTFRQMNASIYKSVTQGELGLCSEVENPYLVEDAEGIKNCVAALKNSAMEITEENVNEVCTAGNNKWNRGPSLTKTDAVLPGYDFSSGVLGLLYIGKEKTQEENLLLDPVNREHKLSSGYSTQSKIYFGASNFSKVDASQFPLRNEVIFTLDDGTEEKWPAIVVSNPVGPSFQGKGNLVYFAFPPEIGYQFGSEGKGSALINNLFNFMIPG